VHVVVAERRRLSAAEAVERDRHRGWHVDPDLADLDLVRELARGVAVAGGGAADRAPGAACRVVSRPAASDGTARC
jgi:hypothetical protein